MSKEDRKRRYRISYVLPLQEGDGHRLGVNGLAIDGPTLFSGGRDGVICAWEDGKLQRKVQAHMDWINDITLVQGCVASASSDQSIKLWNPQTGSTQTIGRHTDYAKVLASSGSWIASGGLDRKVRVWDLSGRQTLDIDIDEGKQRGSVYALAATDNTIASGSIDSIVRLWDVRSGKRMHRFVGHTDIVRSILMSRDGQTVMTASSDSTVKIWSVATGRCEYTLGMPNSVWALDSTHPDLRIFWASDITGLITQTDARDTEWDQGTSTVVCQEANGVSNIKTSGDSLWAATKLSSINRWSISKGSVSHTMQGEHGLIKHTILNNKRQVLTTDTAGEVTLWDLIQCKPIKSYGKRHLEDVLTEINPNESVANWCMVDTRMGALTCVLEDHNCFEAEMYADDYENGAGIDFKEDQRINLGKWILRYLFDSFLQEQIKRDEKFRQSLKRKGPGLIEIPAPELTSWFDESSAPNSKGTIRGRTPAIGLATPGLAPLAETPRTSDEKSDYFTQPLEEPEKAGLLGKIRGLKKKKVVSVVPEPEPEPEPVPVEKPKDLFRDAIQQIHAQYEADRSETSIITPIPLNETPPLDLPNMVVLLQEISSAGGMGLVDLWEGQVQSTPEDADTLERVAPSWLASLLLRNVLPRPEIPKISFMLEPQDLPRVCTELNTRLNANRMLRARKILGYVAERLPNVKPENLELYCNGQLITPLMTLGTIRSYIWRAGTDILFYYKLSSHTL